MSENREDFCDRNSSDSPHEQLQEGDEVAHEVDDAHTDDVSEDSSSDTHHDDVEDCEGDATPTPSENQEDISEDQAEDDPQEVIGKLGDDLALARADLFNVRKEYTNYVRRSKLAMSEHRDRGHREVLEALIPVLDDIYAAREAGDLQEGPFAAIAEKLESVLATNYQFERYGTPGDVFDPNLHDALMANESDEVEVETVAQVLQPGYKKGDAVLRATKVIVDNPA